MDKPFSFFRAKMDFDSSNEGNVSLAAQKDQIMDQVRQELAVANAQELLTVIRVEFFLLILTRLSVENE